MCLSILCFHEDPRDFGIRGLDTPLNPADRLFNPASHTLIEKTEAERYRHVPRSTMLPRIATSTGNATGSKTPSVASRIGAGSHYATIDALTPSSRQFASQPRLRSASDTKS